MDLIFDALRFVLFLFMLMLFARVILGLVLSFARDWRPSGVALVATESVFSVTDPPLKALRRLIPPLQLGQFRLDIAFLVLFFGCYLLSAVLATLQYGIVGA
ncbi:YggT family protein [Demequina sp. NBRC 110053]|uniref:YggT family protein n=1 Tax=Demequina sp. NBRC 110053 TaxID=1570342 RepID=UPI000A06BB50|nr:YggT family protein [Demequina sp. NBRC 110053]